MPLNALRTLTASVIMVLLFSGGPASSPTMLFASAHDDQRFDPQERIPLFLDNVVPEHNPSESYRYLDLPFCAPPGELKFKSQSLAEVLQGSRKVYSAYEVRFGIDTPRLELCKRTLSVAEQLQFREAILSDYHFTMFIDDLPLRGYVGTVTHANAKEGASTATVGLFTSHSFVFHFNRDRLIEAEVIPSTTSDIVMLPPKPTAPLDVTFTYSTQWIPTDVEFADRHPDTVYDVDYHIQWINVITSMVVALFVTAVMAFVVFRALRKDCREYQLLEEEADDIGQEGWKRLHADVFRFPPYKSIFCAAVGTGVQMMLVFTGMLTLAVLGVFIPYGKGVTYATVVGLYVLSAVVAGFVSGNIYRSMGGTMWVNNALVVAATFTLPVFLIWAFLNTVAISYSSTSALPFGTIVALFSVYIFITFPLTFSGALMGRRAASEFDAPTRTKFAPREIPRVKWYLRPEAHVAAAGLLPFMTVVIEFFYIFESMWTHHTSIPFGLLYLTFFAMMITVICCSVSFTYVQLSNENHRWWWFAFLSGGSVAVYVHLYSLYYVTYFSSMSGFLQISFFLGYTSLFTFSIFLMLGAAGYLASVIFVRQLYKSIKSD